MANSPTDSDIRAVHSVLLELIHLLGEDRDHAVLNGGMAPYVLLPDAPEKHVGTFDLDVLIDHRYVTREGYSSIQQRLLEHGYEPEEQSPFRFIRTMEVGARRIRVPVDLLATAYEGTGSNRRHQHVDGLVLRKLAGGGLVVDNPIEVQLDGRLPDGARDRETCRVVRPALFIVLKAIAMDGRVKPKDAYDIHFVVRHYPGGQKQLVSDFRELAGHDIVQRALGILGEKFASPEHTGPRHAASERGQSGEEAAGTKRDAYERVKSLLEALR